MDYLTESDYSERTDHLISGLRQFHADDVIRQIKDFEIHLAALGRGFVGLARDDSGTRLNAFVSDKASKNLDKHFGNGPSDF